MIFLTNHGGISAESITVTKNSLLSELLDMTFQRQVNVHHKHIGAASIFLRNCEKRFFKLANLICLVLNGVIFYKKLWLERKSLHLAYQTFARWKKLKNKNLKF